MADTLTDAARALFASRALAHVATVGAHGEPHVSPVWVTLEGDDVVINTPRGTVKEANLARDPRVALSLSDPDDVYSVIVLRGHVTEITTEGADEMIDALARKYLGLDHYQRRRRDEVRLSVRIAVDRIAVQPA